jgi:anaerobic selenocysteine-containing dehydrogenase
MQRHAGGGMAARNIACLPALVGAWREASGGIVLTTAGFFGMDTAKLGRPDLLQKSGNPRPRTINMTAIGDALLEAKPPVRALYVYNSNPVAIAPESQKVIRGFSREDLFTVVHDLFLTDTCDYADIVLPATTQLEQTDVHTAYGHLYFLANNAAIAPLGESLPNSEVFRRLSRRMGFEDECLYDSDEDICRQTLALAGPYARGIDWDTLKMKGWQRLDVPEIFAPFAQGNFPTPSGKCEFYSESAKKMGMDPLPAFVPPRESVQSNPALAKKYPLAVISPPNRHFLNSSFGNLPFALAEAKAPSLEIHLEDAAARDIGDGDEVRIFNDRGSFTAEARVSERARPGVVVALSVWWKKLTADGKNANEVTSQALSDMGRGATFYDCLVEVTPSFPRKRESSDVIKSTTLDSGSRFARPE